MAFPTTSVLDDFAGTLTGWDLSAYGNGDLSIQSAALTSAAADFGAGEWKAATYGPDCEVYSTVTVIGNATDEVVMHIRESDKTSIWNGYALQYQPNSGAWNLLRITAGAVGATLAAGTQALSAGDKIGVECSGTTIAAKRKPVAGAWADLTESSGTNPATDATYGAAGYLGIEIYDTVSRVDDFSGGTIVTGGGGGSRAPHGLLLGV